VDRLTTGEARGSVGSLSEARAGALTLEAFADIVLPETAGGTAKPASSADGARDVAELVRAVVRFADAPSWVRVELRASCARVLARALPVATLSPRERSAAIGVARRLVADADRRVRAAAASITLDATPTASAGDARP
jgi:hypothetical protein